MTRTILTLRSTTFAVLALLLATSAQASMIVSVERMVNPGTTAHPYEAFTSSSFTTDTDLNGSVQ